MWSRRSATPQNIIVTQGLKTRPSGAEIAVALGVATTYLLVFIQMALPTERSHLVGYDVVAVFIYEALTERVCQGRHVPVPALLAILATTLEWINPSIAVPSSL